MGWGSRRSASGGHEVGAGLGLRRTDPNKVEAIAKSPIDELSVKGLKAKAGDPLRPAKKRAARS
jgi:hypothetical protein